MADIIKDYSIWAQGIAAPADGTPLTSAVIASHIKQPYSNRTTYLYDSLNAINLSLTNTPRLMLNSSYWNYSILGLNTTQVYESWTQTIPNTGAIGNGLLELTGMVGQMCTYQYQGSNYPGVGGFEPTSNVVPTRYHVQLVLTLTQNGNIIYYGPIDQVCLPFTLTDPFTVTAASLTHIRNVTGTFQITTGDITVMLVQNTNMDAVITSNNAIITSVVQGDHALVASKYNYPSINYKMYNV